MHSIRKALRAFAPVVGAVVVDVLGRWLVVVVALGVVAYVN